MSPLTSHFGAKLHYIVIGNNICMLRVKYKEKIKKIKKKQKKSLICLPSQVSYLCCLL